MQASAKKATGEFVTQLQAGNAELHTQVEVARQLATRDAELIAALRDDRAAIQAAAAAEIQQIRTEAARRADAAESRAAALQQTLDRALGSAAGDD